MRAGGFARVVAAGSAVLLAGAALVGCTSSPVGPVASATASAAPAPSSPSSATPTTPPPTQDVEAADPVRLRCAKLVPREVASALIPELRAERGWTPPSSSPAALLERLSGTTCSWTDDAEDLLEVAVARPSAADALALKNDLVARSNSVPTYGKEAYFRVADHVGRVDAFRGRTWIMARSNRFFEPGDAVQVMAAVDRALGFAPTKADSPTPIPTLTISPAPTATTN